jgi:hypothetical protein
LNLIQEDRAVFCKRGRNQTRSIDWPAGDVAANRFGHLRDFDHKPDWLSPLPTGSASGQQMPGRIWNGRGDKMKANFSWVRIGTAAVMLLSLGNLYNSLYDKSRHVSRCGGQLAQLQLIEGQIDTTEAALKAAESQFDRARR